MSQMQPPGQPQQEQAQQRQPPQTGASQQAQPPRAQPQQAQPQQEASGQFVGQQYPTRNTLSQQIRTASVQRLNRCLADATVLVSQARFAHWNVKGMGFYGLHDLFDDLVEELDDHIDDIGERVTALGGEALGTARMAASGSTVPPFPPGAVTGEEYVQLLAERLAVHDANLRQDIEVATQAGDVDTADLLNEISRDVSKYLWFLEAHLQTQPIGANAGGQATEQQSPQPTQGAPAQGGYPSQQQ